MRTLWLLSFILSIQTCFPMMEIPSEKKELKSENSLTPRQKKALEWLGILMFATGCGGFILMVYTNYKNKIRYEKQCIEQASHDKYLEQRVQEMKNFYHKVKSAYSQKRSDISYLLQATSGAKTNKLRNAYSRALQWENKFPKKNFTPTTTLADKMMWYDTAFTYMLNALNILEGNPIISDDSDSPQLGSDTTTKKSEWATHIIQKQSKTV